MATKKKKEEETGEAVENTVVVETAPKQEKTPVKGTPKIKSMRVFEPMIMGYKTVWVEE